MSSDTVPSLPSHIWKGSKASSQQEVAAYACLEYLNFQSSYRVLSLKYYAFPSDFYEMQHHRIALIEPSSELM